MKIGKHQKKSGFSLIELSIIIAVFSVMMTGVLTQYTADSEKKSVGDTFNRMVTVDAALKYYLANKGHLPCPASLTKKKEDVSEPANLFGRQTDCSATKPAGTYDKRVVDGTDSINNGDIRIGMIPVRTLGLSDAYAFDNWGRRYTYVVPKKLAISKAEFDDYTPLDSRRLTIEVDDTTDEYGIIDLTDTGSTHIYGDKTHEKIAYILISHGASGSGGFNIDGVEGTPSCNVPNHIDWVLRNKSKDNENCDHSGKKLVDNDNKKNMHFADIAVNDSVGANTEHFFDDFVYWLQYENANDDIIDAKQIYSDADLATQTGQQ